MLSSLFAAGFSGCTPPQSEVFDDVNSKLEFQGAQSIQDQGGGRWLLLWAPLIGLDNVEYLIFEAPEGEEIDFENPVARSTDTYHLTEDLRLHPSRCYAVRMMVNGTLFERNTNAVCTGHEAFNFKGLAKMDVLESGAYYLSWDATPYVTDGIVFQLFEFTETSRSAGKWDLLATTSDSFYESKVYPIDVRVCFRVKYQLQQIPEDVNETILCNSDELLTSFSGISEIVALGNGEIEIRWLKSVRSDVTGYHIYQGENFNRIIGSVDANTTSFRVDKLSLGIRYYFAVRAHSKEKVEDSNRRVLPFEVSNTAPTVDSIELIGHEDSMGNVVTMECRVRYSDPDGAQILQPTIEFINSSRKSNNETTTSVRQSRKLQPGTVTSKYDVVPQLDSRGDIFTCTLTVFDGIDSSTTAVSNGVPINDTKPIAQSITISKKVDSSTGLHTGANLIEDNDRSNLTNKEGRVQNIYLSRVPQPDLAAEIPDWDGVSVPAAFINEYITRPGIQVGYFDIDSYDDATAIEVRGPINGSFHQPLSCTTGADLVEVCRFECFSGKCIIKFLPDPNFFSGSPFAERNAFFSLLNDSKFEFRVRTSDSPVYESWSNWAAVTIAIEARPDFPLATTKLVEAGEDEIMVIELSNAEFGAVNAEQGSTGKYLNVGAYDATGYFDPDPGSRATDVLITTPVGQRKGSFLVAPDVASAPVANQDRPFTCDVLGMCVAYFLPDTNYNTVEFDAGRPVEIEYAIEVYDPATNSSLWSNSADPLNASNPSPIGMMKLTVPKIDDAPVALPVSAAGEEDKEIIVTFSKGLNYTDVENDSAHTVHIRNIHNGRVGRVGGPYSASAQTFSNVCDSSGTCVVAFVAKDDLNSTHQQPGESATFHFDYQVTSTSLISNLERVTLTVTRVNDDIYAVPVLVGGVENSADNRLQLIEDELHSTNVIHFSLGSGYNDVDYLTNPDFPEEYHATQIKITGLVLENSVGTGSFAHTNSIGAWITGKAIGQMAPCGVDAGLLPGNCTIGLTFPNNFNGRGYLQYEIYGLNHASVSEAGTVYFHVTPTNDSPTAHNINYGLIREDHNYPSAGATPENHLIIIRQAPGQAFANTTLDNYEFGYLDVDSLDENRSFAPEEALEIEITENFSTAGALLHPFYCGPSNDPAVSPDTIDCVSRATLPQDFNSNRGLLVAKYRVRTNRGWNNPDRVGASADINWSNEATLTVHVVPVDDVPVGGTAALVTAFEDEWIPVQFTVGNGYSDPDSLDNVAGTAVAHQLIFPDGYQNRCVNNDAEFDHTTNVSNRVCTTTGANAGRCSFLVKPPRNCIGDWNLAFDVRTVPTGIDVHNHGGRTNGGEVTIPFSIASSEDPPHSYGGAYYSSSEDAFVQVTLARSETPIDHAFGSSGAYFDHDQDNAARILIDKTTLIGLAIYQQQPRQTTSDPSVPGAWIAGVNPVCNSAMSGECILDCDHATGNCDFFIAPDDNISGARTLKFAVLTKSASQNLNSEALWSVQSRNLSEGRIAHDHLSYHGTGWGTISYLAEEVPDHPIAHEMTNRLQNRWIFVREDEPKEIKFRHSTVQSVGFVDFDGDPLTVVEIRTPLPEIIGTFRSGSQPNSALIPVNWNGFYIINGSLCDEILRECSMWFHPSDEYNYTYSHESDPNTMFFNVTTGVGDAQLSSLSPGFFDVRIIPENDPPIISGISASRGVQAMSFVAGGSGTDQLVLVPSQPILEESDAITVSFSIDEGGGDDENWQNISTLTAEVSQSFPPAYPTDQPIVTVSAVSWAGDSGSQDASTRGIASFTITPNPGAYGTARIRITVGDDGSVLTDPVSFPGFFQDVRAPYNPEYLQIADFTPKQTTYEFDVTVDPINDSPVVVIPASSNNGLLNHSGQPAITSDITLGEGNQAASIEVSIDEDTPLTLSGVLIDEGINGPWEDNQVVTVRLIRLSETLSGSGNSNLVREGTFPDGPNGLSLGATDVAGNGDYLQLTQAGNAISIVPGTDLNGSTTFKLEFDDGSGAANSKVTLTVNLIVRPVNDVPTLAGLAPNAVINVAAADPLTTNISGLTIDEGGGTDENPQALTVSIASVTPVSGAVGGLNEISSLTGFSHASALVFSNAEATSAGSLTRAMGLIRQAGTSGTFNVVLRVADDQSGITDIPFSLVIAPFNDTPTISVANSSYSISEDVANITPDAIIVDEGGLSDEDSQIMLVSFTSSNTTVIPTGNISLVNSSGNPLVDAGSDFGAEAAYLKVTPASNLNSVNPTILASPIKITMTVTEQGFTPPAQTAVHEFFVTVNPINDLPEIVSFPATFGVSEVSDPAEATGAPFTITAVVASGPSSAADEFTQQISVTATQVVSDPNGVISSVTVQSGGVSHNASNGRTTIPLLVVPANHKLGTATVRFTLSDGVASIDHDVAITVSPVNDPPSIAGLVTGTPYVITEDDTSIALTTGLILREGPASDSTESAQGLTVSLQFNANAFSSVQVSADPASEAAATDQSAISRSLVVTPKPNFTTGTGSPEQITIRVTDSLGLYAEQNITVEITPVNDLPTGNVACTPSSGTVRVGSVNPNWASCSGVTDVDGDTVTYTVETSDPSHTCGNGIASISAGNPASLSISGLVEDCQIVVGAVANGDATTGTRQTISILASNIDGVDFVADSAGLSYSGGVCTLSADVEVQYTNSTIATVDCRIGSDQGSAAVCSQQSANATSASYIWSKVLGASDFENLSIGVFARFVNTLSAEGDALENVAVQPTAITGVQQPAVSLNLQGVAASGRSSNIERPSNLCHSCSGERGQIAAGLSHACAVADSGVLHCWGSSPGNKTGSNQTSAVSTSVSTKAVAAGDAFTCVIRADNQIECWGGGSASWNLAYFDGSSADKTPIALAAGSDHACALSSNGSVRCWGDNDHGQIGNDGELTTDFTTPELLKVDGIAVSTFKGIFAGGATSCAIGSDDKLYCWGSNLDQQIIAGVPTSYSQPIEKSASATTGVSVGGNSAGNGHICRINAGAMACSGISPAAEAESIVAINSSATSVCYVTASGAAKCLGTGYTGNEQVATAASAVAPFDGGGCVVKSTGGAFCWGTDTSGQRGDGTGDNGNVVVGGAALSAKVERCFSYAVSSGPAP